MPPAPVWFITGASTGFGYNLARYALQKGDCVVATLRNPGSSDLNRYTTTDNLLILQLDVRNAADIASAFEAAKQKFGRIDVVFNNAGVALVGEFEHTPEDKARALFDTNFWGAANVTKEAVRAFRENNPPGGRLLQNTSSAALTCFAGTSFYGASKAALESISEALARELDPKWNIDIILIAAGPFKTEAINENIIIPPSPPYIPNSSSEDDPISKIGANPTRYWINSGNRDKMAGDLSKAIEAFYEMGTRKMVTQDGPPLTRRVFHSYTVQCAKMLVDSVNEAVDVYEREWKERMA